AGGTDLIIELERKIRSAQVLIDISHIPGLDQIRLEKDVFHLGPLVTHNQVVASKDIVERAYPLARACWEVGAPQIRNRGTIAGNLITASPANDTIVPLWALGASVTLRSVRGERTLPFYEFYKGVRKTAMDDDEMLIDISFPAMNEDAHGAFIKLALRRAQAISVVSTTVILEMHRDAIVKARITYGAVAPTIVRAPDVEKYLVGKSLTEEVIALAGELATHAARPIDDVRGPADYRVEMLRVTTLRALRQICDGRERADYPGHPALLWGKSNGHFPTWPEPQVLVHSEGGHESIETTVNGKRYSIRGANDKTLLRMLREDVGLIGTKEGCGEGECGACTVFLDGLSVMACMVAAPRAHGANITTIGNADLYVVGTSAQQAAANTALTNAGANMSRVKYFTYTTNTIWIRDYGPRYIYQGDCRAIVDHTYNRPRPQDDAFPQWFGPQKKQPVYDIPLIHGGGNYHLSALGDSYATLLISNENPSLTNPQIIGYWASF
ncbi:hypothetical protein BAC2_01283, partial [uncultured bacterium]